MTKADLIRLLAPVPDDAPLTAIHDDFPYDITGIETVQATREGGDDHWTVAYFPEVEEEPLTNIVIIR
jgi:hypothetical protein